VPKGGFYQDVIALCRLFRLVLFDSEFYGARRSTFGPLLG